MRSWPLCVRALRTTQRGGRCVRGLRPVHVVRQGCSQKYVKTRCGNSCDKESTIVNGGQASGVTVVQTD